MDDPLAHQLSRTVSAHRLWPAGARLIIAVSGGKDSVVLLHLLANLRPVWKLTLRLAHLDHGLRPESPADAGWVHDLAARWRVPSTIERRDVGAVCASRGWSLEDGARRLRYEFLAGVAERYGAGYIATAHTADDQAETVLMRLLRGTGITGLSAMAPSRQLPPGIALVRPLLESWRAEVDGYALRHRLLFREDASNADETLVRNRIRRRLLPLLEREYNPNIKRLLAQLAEQCRHDAAYLEQAAGRQWRRVAGKSGEVSLTLKAFRRQPKALQRHLVREAIARTRGGPPQLEFRHWRQIEEFFAAQPRGTTLDLPGGVVLERDAQRVRCHRNSHPAPA